MKIKIKYLTKFLDISILYQIIRCNANWKKKNSK